MEETELLNRLRSRDVRAGTNASKFSQTEGFNLIPTLLNKIKEEELTLSSFFSHIEETMMIMGNQVQRSWAIEPVRHQVLRRIQSKAFLWPDHDLRLFVFLIFEKLLRRAYELNSQPTVSLPVRAMMKLHLNELSADYTDRVHIIELLRRWAGNEWDDPRPNAAAPASWSEAVAKMKSLMAKVINGANNPVITLDVYGLLRGFMLALLLLCVMDEHFFINNLRSCLLILQNETYTCELMKSLSDHVAAQKAELETRQRKLFSTSIITKLDASEDLRLFWRIHKNNIRQICQQQDSAAQRMQIAAAVDEFLSISEFETEDEDAFISGAAHIIKTASLAADLSAPTAMPSLLPSLLQAANTDLGESGLRLLNLRLMVLSHDLLDNNSYSYIAVIYKLLVAIAKRILEVVGRSAPSKQAPLPPACDYDQCTSPAAKDKPSLFCSKCKLKVYCCANCQRADWPSHRAECTRWRNTVPL